VQVIVYVQNHILQGCARAIHDTYDLMIFEADPVTVKDVISDQSACMRAMYPLVFVNKTTYHHLHALWTQNNMDIYKLRITCEKWTYNLRMCRTIKAELQTTPAPGMMRMLGFAAGGTAVVAEVPIAEAQAMAQQPDMFSFI